MKNTKLFALTAIVAIMGISTACSTKGADTAPSTTAMASSVAENSETHEASGTISEIKDMQFVLTTDDGDLLFTYDAKPEGLADIKDGDKVTVTYTGEISQVDPFRGTIISVKLN